LKKYDLQESYNNLKIKVKIFFCESGPWFNQILQCYLEAISDLCESEAFGSSLFFSDLSLVNLKSSCEQSLNFQLVGITGKLNVSSESTATHLERGEHVINNNGLKIFKNIIDEFLQRQGTTMGAVRAAGLLSNSQVSRAYDNPMSPEDIRLIREVAVAQIPANVPYIDVNSVLYSRAVLILNDDCVNYMSGQVRMSDRARTLNSEMERISHYVFYVDQAAMANLVWISWC